MTDVWADLLACLDLRELQPTAAAGPVDDGGLRPTAGDRGAVPAGDGAAPAFEGRNQQLSYHRLFGGQLLAQFVRAASLGCPGKAVKSVHVLFPRAGRSREPVRYQVERQHEGGAFATLTILARQEAGVIATASVSMHAPDRGLTPTAGAGTRAGHGGVHAAVDEDVDAGQEAGLRPSPSRRWRAGGAPRQASRSRRDRR